MSGHSEITGSNFSQPGSLFRKAIARKIKREFETEINTEIITEINTEI